MWRHLSTVRQPVVNSRSGKVLAKSEARVSVACSQSEVSSECVDQSEASIDYQWTNQRPVLTCWPHPGYLTVQQESG